MINNRQGNRRRGRGGQRPSGSGQPGNRQDNRQRGNAAQLLEKYKSMARDSQLSGDRVQTEYYLQYADHYFRVLNENKARFDDQRRQRGDDMDDEDGDDSDTEQFEADGGDGGDEGGDERDVRAPQPERSARRERPRRNDGRGEGRGDSRNDSRNESRGESRRDSSDRVNGDAMPFDALPPAIGADAAAAPASEGEEEVRRPRRRTRVARPAEGEDETAPVA